MSARQSPSLELVLWSADIDRLCDFLERAGGLEVEARHPGYAALRCNGSRLALHADEAYKGHPWYDALAREGAARGIGAEVRVGVADVDAAYREALALGAVALHGPYEVEPGIRECQVMGPDGFLFAFWSE
jgi:catechol 2,3-dioxygenase-like lactoylglutathione lyase family enzyme